MVVASVSFCTWNEGEPAVRKAEELLLVGLLNSALRNPVFSFLRIRPMHVLARGNDTWPSGTACSEIYSLISYVLFMVFHGPFCGSDNLFFYFHSKR